MVQIVSPSSQGTTEAVPSGPFGSQRLLQIAVNRRPEFLLQALRRSGAVGRREEIEWCSPLAREEFKEYRDRAALKLLGIPTPLKRPLKDFWPPRGPVWDALGTADRGRPVLIEAKAHIPEAFSPASHRRQPNPST